MRAGFAPALKLVLVSEGGNDDDPRDPGGRTSRGITAGRWAEWRKTHPGLPADVWQAPQASVEAIYKQKYWDVLNCDALPAGVDYAVFDYGVNSGPGRSSRVLQALVGVDEDGEIGPDTLDAVALADPKSLINSICDQRLAFLKGLKTYATFGKGWSARVARVRKDAVAMAGSVPAQAPSPAPSPSQGAKVPERGPSSPADVPPAERAPRTPILLHLLNGLIGLFRKPKDAPAPVEAPKVPPAPAPLPEAPRASAGPYAPWYEKAKGFLGFHEVGVNRGIEQFIKLARTGALGDAWCAIFVNACLEAAGFTGSRSAMARSFESNKNFVKLKGPALGAVVTMWRGSPAAGTGHVGFYAGHDAQGRVILLGGNQSDEVSYAPADAKRIVGYYWPAQADPPVIGKVPYSGKSAAAGKET